MNFIKHWKRFYEISRTFLKQVASLRGHTKYKPETLSAERGSDPVRSPPASVLRWHRRKPGEASPTTDPPIFSGSQNFSIKIMDNSHYL